MIALAIIVLTAALTTAVVRALPRADWVYRSPRLGIAAWYALLATVVMSAGAVVGELLLPWPGGPDAVCAAGTWCIQITGARHGTLSWVMTRLVAALAMLAVIVAGRRVLTGTRVIVRRRRRHRDMLEISGRPHSDPHTTVIDDPRPAAYVVPGSPRRVVVTRGAVERLTPDELAAVLAHERAHASGRHQSLVDVVHVAARIFPRSSLLSTAVRQVERLVEMRADEVAVTSHPPLQLARALVAMATGTAVAPDGLTAATGGDAVERLHRLMRPPRRLPRGAALGIAAILPLLPAVPLALAATCRWWPILSSCLWDL